MKNLFLLILILSGSIAARTADNSNAESKFASVFEVIGTQKVLSLKPVQVSERLKGLCWSSKRVGIERIKYGNLECLNDVGAQTFTIPEETDSHVDLITASFKGAEKYAYALKQLTEALGKPVRKEAESIKWRMKPLKKGQGAGYAELQFVKEENMLYFSIGKESEGS